MDKRIIEYNARFCPLVHAFYEVAERFSRTSSEDGVQMQILTSEFNYLKNIEARADQLSRGEIASALQCVVSTKYSDMDSAQ